MLNNYFHFNCPGCGIEYRIPIKRHTIFEEGDNYTGVLYSLENPTTVKENVRLTKCSCHKLVNISEGVVNPVYFS